LVVFNSTFFLPFFLSLLSPLSFHLPSSLTRVLSNALVSSTHLPVSVCSTIRYSINAVGIFSAPLSSSSFAPKRALPRLPPFRHSFKWPSVGLARNYQQCGMEHQEASSHGCYTWVRNFDRISIGYAFWPCLRDRLTSV